MKKSELPTTKIRMQAAREKLPDGRYLIFYTFGPKTESTADLVKRIKKSPARGGE